MIQVSEAAKAELKRLLASNVDWPGACLRVIERESGSLGLGVDIVQPGDDVLDYEGAPLLVVESGLSARLEPTMLDVEGTGDSAEIVVCELA